MMLVDLAERLTAFKEEHPCRAVTVGDTAWRYRMGGVLAASAVLLLPGGTLVPEPFLIALDALGQRCRVIAPAYPAARTGQGVFCAQPPKAGHLGTWDFGPLTPLPRQAGGWVVR